MRVFITGVSGFVGAALRRQLEAAGHEVRGSSTRAAPGSERLVLHRLGQPVDPRWLEGVDVLVHAAWDLAPATSPQNLAGARLWREAAARHRAHALFISTYSAYVDFPTSYGRDKAIAEGEFADATAVVVRPALVIGEGGLFARLVDTVRRGTVLPLPDGGRPALDALDVRELCEALQRIAEQRRSGSIDLSAGRWSLRELCEAIARGLGKRSPRVLPVPTRPVLRALDTLAGVTAGRLSLDLRERLLGYTENARRTRSSGLADVLGRAPRSGIASVLEHAPRVSPLRGAP